MTGPTGNPFVPAGSRHSHHANAKSSGKTAVVEEERQRSDRPSGALTSPSDGAYRFGSTARFSGPDDVDFLSSTLYSTVLPNTPILSRASSPSTRCSPCSSISSHRSLNATHDSGAVHSASALRAGSPRCSLEKAALQDQIRQFQSEVGHMSEKVARVQKDVDEASVNLRMLRELMARLESFGGRDLDKVELQCGLIRTQLDGLEQTAKTIPHYYPSYPMYTDMMSTLNKILSSHEYVNRMATEKNDLLRENEKLRNELQLLKAEMERLKRRHAKDKKVIGELERLSSSTKLQGIDSPLKMFSPQKSTMASSSQREEDLKLIEMLRDAKAVLSDNGEEQRAKNKDYADLIIRLKDVSKPGDRAQDSTNVGGKPAEQGDGASMDSYFRILDRNISLINHQLTTTERSSPT